MSDTTYPSKVDNKSDLNLKKYARFYPDSRYVTCALCGFDVCWYSRFTSSGAIGISIPRKTLYLCEECGGE